MAWMDEQFKEARERIENGPAWVRAALATDYSARRQIVPRREIEAANVLVSEGNTMETVRAKFYVNAKEQTAHGTKSPNRGGKVELSPVYGNEPASENKAFWDATPNGKISMWITNVPAFDAFEIGREYYIDFTPAPVE